MRLLGSHPQKLDDESRESAIDELIEDVGAVVGLLKLKIGHDIENLEHHLGLALAEREDLVAAILRAKDLHRERGPQPVSAPRRRYCSRKRQLWSWQDTRRAAGVSRPRAPNARILAAGEYSSGLRSAPQPLC